MATTDPVEIVVDIIDNFSDELAKLESMLQALDRQTVDAKFVIDVSERSVAQAEAVRAAVGRDIRPNMDLGGTVPTNLVRRMSGIGGLVRGGGLPDLRDRRGMSTSFRLNRQLNNMAKRWREVGSTLVRYRPSIMDWWNVLALLIPILITLAGAAVGVIAALGGIATAAAGIVGLGLLGWGDSATESLKNLKLEARSLGSELFDVLRPASAALQPLLESAMAALPGMVENLVDELIALRGFGPGLGDIGAGFMNWVETSLQLINQWREEILFAANEVGKGFGSFIQDFLVFGLRELVNNIEAYKRLAMMFADVLRILFEVSKAAAFTVAAFEPFFDILSRVAQFISRPLVTAMLTFAAATFIGVGAIVNLTGAWAFLTGLGIITTLRNWGTAFLSLASKIWTANTALAQMRALLATTGIGLAVIGAGLLAHRAFQASQSGPGGSARVTNINIEGDVGRRQMHDFKDIFGTEFDNHSGARSVMKGPNG